MIALTSPKWSQVTEMARHAHVYNSRGLADGTKFIALTSFEVRAEPNLCPQTATERSMYVHCTVFDAAACIVQGHDLCFKSKSCDKRIVLINLYIYE